MLEKLLALYPGAFITDRPPIPGQEKFHIFHNEAERKWISIPEKSISQKEVDLLRAIYVQAEVPSEKLPPLLQQWKEYLFYGGKVPAGLEEEAVRLIQFEFLGENHDHEELEMAIKGFFSEDILVLWEGSGRALVVERGEYSLDERDLASMADAFESDFYIKTRIYIGRRLPVSDALPSQFREEQNYFDFAKKNISSEGYYTFEKVFPAYVSSLLPRPLAEALNAVFAEAFRSDDEMFTTVKGFLENGSNASLAAKKLYIHRNTLQYRVDKFTDKTGVSLKDFNSAFTVYLACLLYDRDRGTN
ncbi:helix-turn-helix domain-containing protein [Neobacillus sp. YIM B06451]|uniref:PucR family transcriptional regulator n=1 Tax=Neobacillus sp. YIM B06451 TaxID=3070994 RepID=UPI00292D6275|nr:helix-turn-helix domain-containing protein [Neobacillus sp. YIM B06451]